MKLNLRFFAIAIMVCALSSNILGQQKPNIIFILSDDVGFETPPANGGESFSIPNIDSMAHHESV